MTGFASRFSDSLEIKVNVLAKVMVLAGIQGTSGLTTLGAGNPPGPSFKRSKYGEVTVISNAEALRLARAH